MNKVSNADWYWDTARIGIAKPVIELALTYLLTSSRKGLSRLLHLYSLFYSYVLEDIFISMLFFHFYCKHVFLTLSRA